MTSNHHNGDNDDRDKDAANLALLERRTTSDSLSSSNYRTSFRSSDTGESSKTASERNSLKAISSSVIDGQNGILAIAPIKDGRGSHRSHRSRNSGGFLLSDATFEPPTTSPKATDHTPKRTSSDHKGKAALQTPEKKHTKRRSGIGLGIGGSPLAANVTSAETKDVGADSAADQLDGNGIDPTAKPHASGLDVDSTQIVNLALNLSESRRAARRNVSSPLPPLTPAFGDSFAGGSLKHHLQQQRRVSRNVSPKPDREDRLSSASSRAPPGQNMNSPLKTAFESDQDGMYQYHFSASTLARAEKAKNAIELMAQYRRLLQILPPLKPQTLDSPTVASANSENSPNASRPISATSSTSKQVGMEYNPLQYIRNRKVRARGSIAIDGEAQGFGNVDKVASWVDEISSQASYANHMPAGRLFMPSFSDVAEAAATPHNSKSSASGKTQAAQTKIKRPRIDWTTNPADMIADLFWLEQDDNKRFIEDRRGRAIFPPSAETKRVALRGSEEPESRLAPGPAHRRERPNSPDLRIDTKLPEFKSVKADSGQTDSTTSRAKQKLREATRMHGNNGSAHHHSFRIQSLRTSDSDSSDSEVVSGLRRRRSGTADSHDRGKDILEKQMMEMLANENRQSIWGSEATEGKSLIDSVDFTRSTRKDETAKPSNDLHHSRSGSISNKETHSRRASTKNNSSGRTSLEVPRHGPRSSVEELDSTAPNSPQLKASKGSRTFFPSIGVDLSPPPSDRPSSPTRNPISKVRSRISQLQDLKPDRSRSRVPEAEPAVVLTNTARNVKEPSPDDPATPEKQKRSVSPVKKADTSESARSAVKKVGSIRRGKTSDESSGIRGLFKGSRNPVSRVSEFIWRKEPSSVGASSGFSTDESDIEELRAAAEQKDSGNSSIGVRSSDEVDVASLLKEKPYHHDDLPVFTTSRPEDRGRPTRARSEEVKENAENEVRARQAREDRRRSSRAHMLSTPRIDVQNASPTSSPNLSPHDRYQRDSSVSDIDSRRESFATGGDQGADARSNDILGRPGKRNNIIFATGLSAFEANNNRRPSLADKRHWSISDRAVSVHRGPMTKQEIARVKALLLSSGIKAKEIARRAAIAKSLQEADEDAYEGIEPMAQRTVGPVPKKLQHIVAARILADNIQLSSRVWQDSADHFTGVTIQKLLDRVETLRGKVTDELTPTARKAADEADEVLKDLMTSQLLKGKAIMDTMDKMMRQRRRRFRWLRRGGWLMVEWALVGVMWMVWFVVVFVRVFLGIGNGVIGVGSWLVFR